MNNRLAVLLAAVALLAVTNGAVFTSNAERPLYSFGASHIVAGTLAIVLAAGLAIRLSIAGERPWLNKLVWITLTGMIVEGGLGFPAQPQPPVVRLAHSLLAQLLFAAIVSLAVFTSQGWKKASKLDGGLPSLRTLSAITVAAVILQAALGVAFRHGFMGVVLHVVGALVTGILVLALAMSVIYRPEHERLRPAGVGLLIITAVQVFLGLALLSMVAIEDMDPVAVIATTMIHTAASTLTLAAAVAMALLVWRSIPAAANP
jgi:heme A synthase